MIPLDRPGRDQQTMRDRAARYAQRHRNRNPAADAAGVPECAPSAPYVGARRRGCLSRHDRDDDRCRPIIGAAPQSFVVFAVATAMTIAMVLLPVWVGIEPYAAPQRRDRRR